jgi:hypothetical protein
MIDVSSHEACLIRHHENFLGQGNWERNMLGQVNSMNTEQRGEVYRRLFVH